MLGKSSWRVSKSLGKQKMIHFFGGSAKEANFVPSKTGNQYVDVLATVTNRADFRQERNQRSYRKPADGD